MDNEPDLNVIEVEINLLKAKYKNSNQVCSEISTKPLFAICNWSFCTFFKENEVDIACLYHKIKRGCVYISCAFLFNSPKCKTSLKLQFQSKWMLHNFLCELKNELDFSYDLEYYNLLRNIWRTFHRLDPKCCMHSLRTGAYHPNKIEKPRHIGGNPIIRII